MTLKGFPIEGRREDLEELDVGMRSKHPTFTQATPYKYSLDTFPYSVYEFATEEVAEAGSNSSRIIRAGHQIRKGDFILFDTTANAIEEDWIQVLRVEDDAIILGGSLSAEVSSGDTFDVLRPIFNKVAPDGSTLATVESGPIRILRGASGALVPANVSKDTADAANTIPMPVEVVSSAGAEINITAGDINVQNSASGVNYSSIRLGDGTNEMTINAEGEALVKDTDVETAITDLSAKIPATLGQKTKAASLAVTLASDEDALNVGDITGTITLPTGAATAANQSATITAIEAVEADVEAAVTLLTSLDNKDFATQTTLSNINMKTLTPGQNTSAGSSPVVLSTEQQVILTSIQTSVNALAAEIGANGVAVEVHDLDTLATEATLLNVNTTVGNIQTASTQIRDAVEVLERGIEVKSYNRVDFAITNITDTFTTFEGSTEAIFRGVRIFYAGGQPLLLNVVGATNPLMMIPPGADFEIRFPEVAASSALQLRAVNDVTIDSGQIIFNWLG